MPYELKPLSCDPAKLTGLSEKLIVSHWENNYGGAVKRLNAIEQRLAELNWASAPVFEINGLKREEMIASGSMILHEVYFDSLGGTGGDPDGALKAAIERDFGSVDAWRTEFTAMGKALGRRPRPQPGRRHAADRPRHVRAQLPHGLRRQGRGLCGRLHAEPVLDGGRGRIGQRGGLNEARHYLCIVLA